MASAAGAAECGFLELDVHVHSLQNLSVKNCTPIKVANILNAVKNFKQDKIAVFGEVKTPKAAEKLAKRFEARFDVSVHYKHVPSRTKPDGHDGFCIIQPAEYCLWDEECPTLLSEVNCVALNHKFAQVTLIVMHLPNKKKNQARQAAKLRQFVDAGKASRDFILMGDCNFRSSKDFRNLGCNVWFAMDMYTGNTRKCVDSKLLPHMTHETRALFNAKRSENDVFAYTNERVSATGEATLMLIELQTVGAPSPQENDRDPRATAKTLFSDHAAMHVQLRYVVADNATAGTAIAARSAQTTARDLDATSSASGTGACCSTQSATSSRDTGATDAGTLEPERKRQRRKK